MRFIIPVDEGLNEDGSPASSRTYMTLDMGNISMRVAKRKLRIIFAEWGMTKKETKIMIKELCS